MQEQEPQTIGQYKIIKLFSIQNQNKSYLVSHPQQKDQKLILIKMIKINARESNSSQYKEFRSFYDKIAKNTQNSQLIFIKQCFEHTIRKTKYCCIAMQYMENGNICHLALDDTYCLSFKMTIMQSIAECIDKFHKKYQKSHENIKLQNIFMFSKTQTLKLADSGLQFYKKHNLKQSESYNMLYTPPEFYNTSLNFDEKKIDVWMVGILFTEIILSKRIVEIVSEELQYGFKKSYGMQAEENGQFYRLIFRKIHQITSEKNIITFIKALLQINPDKRISFEKIIEFFKTYRQIYSPENIKKQQNAQKKNVLKMKNEKQILRFPLRSLKSFMYFDDEIFYKQHKIEQIKPKFSYFKSIFETQDKMHEDQNYFEEDFSLIIENGYKVNFLFQKKIKDLLISVFSRKYSSQMSIMNRNYNSSNIEWTMLYKVSFSISTLPEKFKYIFSSIEDVFNYLQSIKEPSKNIFYNKDFEEIQFYYFQNKEVKYKSNQKKIISYSENSQKYNQNLKEIVSTKKTSKKEEQKIKQFSKVKVGQHKCNLMFFPLNFGSTDNEFDTVSKQKIIDEINKLKHEEVYFRQNYGQYSNEVYATTHKIGLLYCDCEKFKDGIQYLEKAYNICVISRGERDEESIRLLAEIALCYSDIAQFEKSLELYEKSLKFSYEVKNERLIAYRLYMIGSLLLKQERIEKASEYFRKFEKINPIHINPEHVLFKTYKYRVIVEQSSNLLCNFQLALQFAQYYLQVRIHNYKALEMPYTMQMFSSIITYCTILGNLMKGLQAFQKIFSLTKSKQLYQYHKLVVERYHPFVEDILIKNDIQCINKAQQITDTYLSDNFSTSRSAQLLYS